MIGIAEKKWYWFTATILAVLLGGSWVYLSPTEGYDICYADGKYGSWYNITETVHVNDDFDAVGKYRCDIEDKELWCGGVSGGKHTRCYYILEEVDISNLDKFELKNYASVNPKTTEMTMTKWGEDYLKVKRPSTGKAKLSDGKVVWEESKEITRVYELENGMEFEIILKEKPATNVFEFEINDTEFNFYYQPPLNLNNASCNATDCGEAHRPENVVGSYAVYHKFKRDNEYMTGKAFHIYRPLITDANNKTIWGELKYREGILSIEIDEKWLEKATYPVRVDPTIGCTSIGTTSTDICDNYNYGPSVTDSHAGNVITVTEGNGSITHLNAYIVSAVTDNAAVDIALNVYDNESDGSHARIGQEANSDTVSSSGEWITYTADPQISITNGSSYILSAICDGSSMGSEEAMDLKYDSTAGKEYVQTEGANDYTGADPWTPSVQNTGAEYSIYANYTVAGAADVNLSFGPPDTDSFMWVGCSPDWENASATPENQTDTYGIDYVCNNGTVAGDIQVKLSSALNNNWTVYVDNESGFTDALTLSTSYQTIYDDLAQDACGYVWFKANCSYAHIGPGAYEIYQAV